MADVIRPNGVIVPPDAATVALGGSIAGVLADDDLDTYVLRQHGSSSGQFVLSLEDLPPGDDVTELALTVTFRDSGYWPHMRLDALGIEVFFGGSDGQIVTRTVYQQGSWTRDEINAAELWVQIQQRLYEVSITADPSHGGSLYAIYSLPAQPDEPILLPRRLRPYPY